MKKQSSDYLKTLCVPTGKNISLSKDFETDEDRKIISKEEGEDWLKEGMKQLAEMQDKLYAHNQYSVLIVLQAMDAAGKDGVIKTIAS